MWGKGPFVTLLSYRPRARSTDLRKQQINTSHPFPPYPFFSQESNKPCTFTEEARRVIENTPELCYLTHVVLRMFEDLDKARLFSTSVYMYYMYTHTCVCVCVCVCTFFFTGLLVCNVCDSSPPTCPAWGGNEPPPNKIPRSPPNQSTPTKLNNKTPYPTPSTKPITKTPPPHPPKNKNLENNSTRTTPRASGLRSSSPPASPPRPRPSPAGKCVHELTNT